MMGVRRKKTSSRADDKILSMRLSPHDDYDKEILKMFAPLMKKGMSFKEAFMTILSKHELRTEPIPTNEEFHRKIDEMYRVLKDGISIQQGGSQEYYEGDDMNLPDAFNPMLDRYASASMSMTDLEIDED